MLIVSGRRDAVKSPRRFPQFSHSYVFRKNKHGYILLDPDAKEKGGRYRFSYLLDLTCSPDWSRRPLSLRISCKSGSATQTRRSGTTAGCLRRTYGRGEWI